MCGLIGLKAEKNIHPSDRFYLAIKHYNQIMTLI